jgi:hypothetical protein
MHRIFAGMAIWAVIFMLGEGVLGVITAHSDPHTQAQLIGWHMVVGVFIGVYVSILQVMVMFHFIGSGKEIKQAIEVLGGDTDVVKRLRRMKMQVMPAATFAPILVGAGVILGGGAHTKALGDWAWIHWALSYAGLLLNLYAFPIEYRCLVANLELLKEVDDRIRREISPGLYHE